MDVDRDFKSLLPNLATLIQENAKKNPTWDLKYITSYL
jgi:hypothetical protein